MRTTLIAALICLASLILPGAHGQQTETLRAQIEASLKTGVK